MLRDGILQGNWVDDRPPAVDGDFIEELNKKTIEIMGRIEERTEPFTEVRKQEEDGPVYKYFTSFDAVPNSAIFMGSEQWAPNAAMRYKYWMNPPSHDATPDEAAKIRGRADMAALANWPDYGSGLAPPHDEGQEKESYPKRVWVQKNGEVMEWGQEVAFGFINWAQPAHSVLKGRSVIAAFLGKDGSLRQDEYRDSFGFLEGFAPPRNIPDNKTAGQYRFDCTREEAELIMKHSKDPGQFNPYLET